MKPNLSPITDSIKTYRPHLRLSSTTFGWILVTFVVLATSGTALALFQRRQAAPAASIEAVADTRIKFLDEIYGIIQDNYWEKQSDDQLSELFRLAAEKLNNSTTTLPSKDRAGMEAMVSQILSQKSDAEKKEFVASLADMVLANLEPFGRSRLYTQKLQQDLSNAVNNIDPSANLYANLGVDNSASQQEIDQAYQQKAEELSKDKTEEGKEKLAQATRAHEALKTEERRERYDQAGIEPSVTYQKISPAIVHLRIKRFSPTTLQELVNAAAEADRSAGQELNTLIIDLRGNIGGAIDQLSYFLGPFVGPGRYAYDYYSRGETLPFKTQSGWLDSLVRYKKTVILADSATQSSAEVMAASLKKFNVGVLVGTPTKGWGTIERVFDIKTQIDPSERYAVFLVHTITLRDDGQPIEGRGVEPAVDIRSEDWERQLNAYFNTPSLTAAVRHIWNDVK